MEIQVIKVGIDNCYIIRDEGTILIDAGMPEKFVSRLFLLGEN